MTTNFCEHEIISIVIPVYNAEKYLGYCLNSVASQSYPYFQAVLVNDGSTDGSLAICENYARVDARFHVISIPNGGVSNARNKGLQVCNGKYLAFLDSDDLLHPDALEKLLALAKKSGKDLVVGDVLMVDFSAPDLTRTRLCADWVGERPCIMNYDEFTQKRMQLIWHTSLLEGLYGKLYDLSLWKKIGIQFPLDLNLGEDFVANMQYYKSCNGAAFLGETIHYYNNIQDSDSLTHKYRPDLFECKMDLMERLAEHLGSFSQLPPKEQVCYHDYVASSGLRCISDLIENAPLDKKDKISRLQQMLSNDRFIEGVCKADYIIPEYLPWKDFVLQRDAEGFFECDPPQVSTQLGQGILNRLVRKILQVTGHHVSEESRTRLEKIESEVFYQGIRNTFRQHLQAKWEGIRRSPQKHKREVLLSRLDDLDDRIRILGHQITTQSTTERETLIDQFGDLCNQNRILEKQISEQFAAERELLKVQPASLDCCFHNFEMQVANQIHQATQSVKDYVWLSEQRLSRDALLSQINDLRQRKKAIIMASAEHANIGDAAITLAEQEFLLEFFPDYFQVEFSTYEIDHKYEYFNAILNEQDIIFINGGGNMGSRYVEEEELHRRVVREFPDHKIVIFPQTIDFENTPQGQEQLSLSKMVYNSHHDLTLFVRGQQSLDFAREHFPQVTVSLMPDMVHQLNAAYCFERQGILLCLRSDQEGIWDEEQSKTIKDAVRATGETVDTTNNMDEQDISRDRRALVVRKQLQNFAAHRVVVTDRLHGMVFSAITGTPCVVLASDGPKIQDYYTTFLNGVSGIYYIGNNLANLPFALDKARNVHMQGIPAAHLRADLALLGREDFQSERN